MSEAEEGKERINAYFKMMRSGIENVNHLNIKTDAKESLKLKLLEYERFMMTFIKNKKRSVVS